MNKVNSKIMITATLCFIFITLLVGLASIITGAQIINKEAQEKLIYLTQDKAGELDDLIETPQAVTEILKIYVEQSFSMKKFKQNGVPYTLDYLNSIEQFFFKTTLNTDGIMGSYFVYSPDFTKLDSLTEIWILDKNENGDFEIVKDRFPASQLYPLEKPSSAWFYNPMSTKKGGWTNPYSDYDTHINMISYTTPVFVDNKFIGVVGMDLSIRHMAEIVSKLKTYNSGKTFLLDRNYHLIVGKDFSSSFKESKAYVPDVLLKALKKKDRKIIEYTYDNIPYIASYTYLLNGFTLVITAPKAEILKQKHNMQLLVTGITLLGIILAIIIILNL